ncbi:MAG: glycosyltransferase family 2 protein [Arthrobacter sp.]
MQRPLITIITIAWNDLAALKRTRKSVARQGFQDREHLIVDGGSTDGTVEWLKSLTDEDVRWTSEPDDGVYDAMNKGGRDAKGELLIFLNAGDTYTDNWVLERIAEDYRRTGFDWAYSKAIFVDEQGNPTRPSYGLNPYTTMAHAYKRLTICHQTVVMRTSRFLKLRGFKKDHGLVADYGLLLEAGIKRPPLFRDHLDIAYLDGGVSAINHNMAMDKHKVRVDVFELGPVAAAADRAYAQAQDAYVSCRRFAKRTIVKFGGGAAFRRQAERSA